MAILATTTPTLLDVTRTLGPDGKQMALAEILNQENEVLNDMGWKEGNLVTGHRHAQRNTLPTVAWRRLNKGVPRSKATGRLVDEAAAILEGNAQIDRELAIMSGNIAAYRAQQGTAFVESMGQEFTQTLFYGNSTLADNEFTGFAPRFGSKTGPYADQIIDAGGTGTDNRSIWLIGWDQTKVTGIYPKNTIAGLQHMDVTSNVRIADDGHPIGDMVNDADGNPYLAYQDHWTWKCGLSVEDGRYVVRIANIDWSLVNADITGGAYLQRLMVEASERLHRGTTKTAWYMTRGMRTMLRQQILEKKNANLSWMEMAGKKIPAFDEYPIRRVDQLEVDEARVV